jgi:hypothetical protein
VDPWLRLHRLSAQEEDDGYLLNLGLGLLDVSNFAPEKEKILTTRFHSLCRLGPWRRTRLNVGGWALFRRQGMLSMCDYDTCKLTHRFDLSMTTNRHTF